MPNLRFYFFSIVTIFFISSFLYSQESTHTVIINQISVNGDTLTADELNNLVVSQSDSVLFHFYCKTIKGAEVPFLFQLKISNSLNESTSKPQRLRKALYTALPEDNYTLTISAFSSVSQWSSNSAIIKFRVNNKEASLMKQIKSLKLQLDKKLVPVQTNLINIKSLIIGLSIGIIFASIILLILVNRKKGENKTSQIKVEAVNMGNETQLSDEQYKKIASENSNLRAEIAALRGQIDALQKRGEELRKQNKDLQEKIDLLSKSKSEIEDLQRQKDELFALIIHDIKNPVALIKNLVELLRSYDLTATEQHEIIDDIFTTTTKIVSLSQEVSKILALESSTLELNVEKVNMNEIISDVAKRYEKAAKEKDIVIHFNRNESIPECEIDVIKIDDVIDNLVSNAIKFSYPGGKVQLACKQVDQTIVVDISDKGQGLSEEDIQKAFKRGAMLSARPTGNEHSSGLGLWIVKRLIEVHRGRVWIKSAVSKGSTFSFSVPIRRIEDKG